VHGLETFTVFTVNGASDFIQVQRVTTR